MAIVFPEISRKLVMDILLNNTEQVRLRLYQNDYTPDDDTLLVNLTEANFSGYVYVVPDFSAAAINGSGQGECHANDNTFTHDATVDAGNTIYGWYLVSTDLGGSEQILFVERFASPIVVIDDGDRVRFDLRLFDQLA